MSRTIGARICWIQTHISLNPIAQAQLEWWLDPANLSLGVPFSTLDPPGRSDGFWHLALPVDRQAHKLAGTWAIRRLLASGRSVEGQAHKLAGTQGSMADPASLTGTGPSGGISIGQLDHCLLHQQTDPVPPVPGHVGMVRPTRHSAGCSPTTGDTQRLSRCAVQGEILPNGVVHAPSNAQSSVLHIIIR